MWMKGKCRGGVGGRSNLGLGFHHHLLPGPRLPVVLLLYSRPAS